MTPTPRRLLLGAGAALPLTSPACGQRAAAGSAGRRPTGQAQASGGAPGASPGASQPGGRAAVTPAPNCARTSVGFVALPDLGTGMYRGAQGGLYPAGINRPPEAYRQAGLAAAARVQPLDPDGAPGVGGGDGRAVLLSLGMSNATQEFSAFKRLADADPRKRQSVVLVDGAVGSQDAETIKDPVAPYWAEVERRLRTAGVTPAQVQAVWLKEAIAGESHPFPGDARRLQDALARIVDIAGGRFPQLRLLYLSSRTYAGYATSPLNPEPAAYDSGFAVKWLIEGRIDSAGTPGARPWVGWGPYLWTDGTRGRADGLEWTCDDVAPDGTHPSPAGMRKVADLLLRFFTGDETARPWFAA